MNSTSRTRPPLGTLIVCIRVHNSGYMLTLKDSQGKPVTDHGKLVEVWKKQADGKWKSVVDIFNSDLPLPAPPEKKK